MSVETPIGLRVSPNRKDEISAALLLVSMQLETFYHNLPDDRFTISKSGKWSPQQQMQHIISSAQPVVLALQMPKAVLEVFGKHSGNGSRSYDAIVERYKESLQKGAKASLPFKPFSFRNVNKERGILKWKNMEQSFRTALYYFWNEVDLDSYRVPHPILGMLTIREMLFFTCYHTLHHINSMRKVYT